MRAMMRYTAALAAVGALSLTACSVGATPENTEEATELDSLSIMVPYFSATPPEDDDAIGAALDELVGAHLDIRWVPNADYQAQTTTVLASGNVPDAMVITAKDQAFVQTAQAGGFWDLTDYINEKDYPNLAAADPDITQAASINGRTYGIYRGRDLVRQNVAIRKDWLENLGLNLPKTTDDLAEIARAFTEDDPDGDGVDDTYGLIWANWGLVGQGNSLDAVSAWFGAGNVWIDNNGTLEPEWIQPEWKESLDFLKDLYEAGYTNPDFATLSADDWNTPFLNGQGGIIIDQGRANTLLSLFRESSPESFWEFVDVAGQPEGPNGKFSLPTAGYAGIVAVSKATVKTEAQLKGVLAVLDKLNTQEAQVLLSNGIQGENFSVSDDGYAVYDPDQQAMTDMAQKAWAQLGMIPGPSASYKTQYDNEYQQDLYERSRDLATADAEDAVFNAAAGLIAPTYVTNQATLDQIISDARVQYIAGQIDEDGLEAAVERWRTSGGDRVTDELNKLYADQKK